METARAILIREHGEPGRVARCEEVALPPPGTGEARVRVVAAPINPADINVLEGRYAALPELPAVPGVEGVGVLENGERVLLPAGFGSWREAGNFSAAALVRVPEGVSDEQAAMLRINPATALRMLRDFVPLGRGDVVLQNAANSGVGRAVIELARDRGVRTINLVRRAELAVELRALGADVVIAEGDDARAQIAAATGGAPVRLALNAVGGDSALTLAKALAPGGTLVTYGAMGRQPLRIPNGLLIFGDVQLRGFWVSRWFREAMPEAVSAMFTELFFLARRGAFRVPVAGRFALEECAAALALAQQGGRAGKVLFTP